jgi:hypothetical protein
MRRAIVLLSGLLGWAGAAADDRFSVEGMVDLRVVHTDATAAYQYGGLGRLRFDEGSGSVARSSRPASGLPTR